MGAAAVPAPPRGSVPAVNNIEWIVMQQSTQYTVSNSIREYLQAYGAIKNRSHYIGLIMRLGHTVTLKQMGFSSRREEEVQLAGNSKTSP